MVCSDVPVPNGTVVSELVLGTVVTQLGVKSLSGVLHEFATVSASFANPRFKAARAVGDFTGRLATTPRKTHFRLLAKLSRTDLTTRKAPKKSVLIYPISILLSQASRSARTQLL